MCYRTHILFFGYKLFKIQCAIVGFLIGFAGGGTAVAASFQNYGAALLVGVILGILFAFIAVKVYFIGVFLTNGICAFLIIGAISGSVSGGIVVGIVVGIISAFFAKIFIIVSTSVLGGVLAAQGAISVFGAGSSKGALVLFSIIFIAAGTVFQFKNNRNSPSANDTAPSIIKPSAEGLSSSTADPAGELKRYSSMLSRGLISQEEFDAAKKNLTEKK